MVCVETNSNQVADKCSASESNWNWGKLCPEFQNGIVWGCLWGVSKPRSSRKPRSLLPATFSIHKCVYIHGIRNFLRFPNFSKITVKEQKERVAHVRDVTPEWIAWSALKSKREMLEGTEKFCLQKNRMKALACGGFVFNDASRCEIFFSEKNYFLK